MAMQLIPVTDEQRIRLVAEIADRVWHEHYARILEKPQIDYMVEKFQSADSIAQQIREQGYRYYLMQDGGGFAGYTAVQVGDGRLFLSKLYIDAACRGRGYARQTLCFLEERCRENGLETIWLTVNRHNAGSIAAYEKMGFVKIREQAADIGGGFVMDDFIMEKSVK